MKKLLFIFVLAAICTITTSSFKPARSTNTLVLQTISVVSERATDKKDDAKKEGHQKKKGLTSSCCQVKSQTVDCSEPEKGCCTVSEKTCSQKREREKK